MLEVGETIIHKSHGLCVVKEKLQIAGQDYYRLVPSFDSSMSIFVPFSKENEILRAVLTRKEADELIDYMRTIDDKIIDDTKERRDSFHRLLLSGDLKDIAYMCRKLYLLKQYKDESNAKFCLTDSTMFEKVHNMLFDELAVAYNVNRDSIVEYVHNLIDKKKPA